MFSFFIIFFLIKIVNCNNFVNEYNWPIDINSRCQLFNTFSNKKCIIHSCKDIKNSFNKIDISHHFIVSMKNTIILENENNRNQLIKVLNKRNVENNNFHISSTISNKKYAKIKYLYNYSIFGFSAILSPDALHEVINNTDVISIEQDEYAYSLTFQRNPIWNLDRIDQRSNQLKGLIN